MTPPREGVSHVVSSGPAPGYDCAVHVQRPRKAHRIRDVVLDLWSVTQMAQSPRLNKGFASMRGHVAMIECIENGTISKSRRKRIPMEVEQMIRDWKEQALVLCTAHSRDEIDAAEHRMDELLKPLLTAPVAQLREFYTGLRKALEDDPDVPFFVWSMFKAYDEIVVKVSKDDAAIVRLRGQIADRIAQKTAPIIADDLTKALAGALRWRDAKTLERVEAAIDKAPKGKRAKNRPRAVGRESCLFLEVPDASGTAQVML